MDDEQVETIKQAAFSILETIGGHFTHSGALELFRNAGAMVQDNQVKIPIDLIESCLKSAPKGFIIYDREGQEAMDVRGRNAYYGTSTASPNTRDPYTSEIRKTEISDISRSALVADALKNIDFIMPMGCAQDVPALTVDLHDFPAVVSNTTKPIVFIGYTPEGVRSVYDMAAILSGGIKNLRKRPFVILYPEPVAPLCFPDDVVEKMLIAAELGMPQIPGSTVQPGATSPVTLAGSVAQMLAEGLMSLILIQLKNPGAPCFLSGNLNIFDMKTTLMSIAAPEMSLGMAAQAEVAQSLGLPTWGLAGSTDSKLLDAQAGMESIFSIITQGLAGINLIHDVGYMDMAMVCSLEMLILGDEACGMARHFLKGIDVNKETLALDIINKVGPGGNFIQERHTFNNFRKELWMPSLFTREHYSNWSESGLKSIEHRIKGKIETILATHEPKPIAMDVIKDIESLREEKGKEIIQKYKK